MKKKKKHVVEAGLPIAYLMPVFKGCENYPSQVHFHPYSYSTLL